MADWLLIYDNYNPTQEGLREALCALGNGYFVTRGAAPDVENDKVHYSGTYLAGGYNRLVTEIDGHKIENEDLVNLPNWLPLTLRIEDDAWFHIDQIEVLAYRQVLDLKRGLLTREIRFRDDNGRITLWLERRLVSMVDKHLAGFIVTLTPENWSGTLTLRSALDGRVTNDGVARYRDLNGNHLKTLSVEKTDEDTVRLCSRTRQSGLEIAEAVRTRCYRGGKLMTVQRQTRTQDDWIGQDIVLDMTQGQAIDVEKIVALYTSKDNAISEPKLEAKNVVGRAGRFDALLAKHQLAWQHLWEECDIALQHCPKANLKLRVYIFHLLQTVSHHTIDRDIGVPARGWHGEAYRGHIFWDELFIFPFLNMRLPVLTRALLRYRYRRLPAARRLAQAAGYRGAAYPWQSGSDGREESQRLHLNPKSGRWIPDNTYRQRHINVAIAYNIWHYYQVTGDYEFLYDYGAEMLLEIARFWASMATYHRELDRYEILGVLGPDEYHTAYPNAAPEKEGGLNNNAYTNVMVAWVLNRTQDVLSLLPEDRCRKLCDSIGLHTDELDRWDEISRKLRLDFHDDGIISQFQGYDQLQEFDWHGYREKYGDIQRLDRILEAENDTPNRYKVSKQADVLMLFYLFSADELAIVFERLGYPFDKDTIPKNIDYYMQRTSHGSTLSWVVHAWVLARANRPQGWDLFHQALDSDITDIQGGTTPEGIHLGAMAGSIDLVQRCFTGLETRAGILYFDPSLPQELTGLKIQLRYRRHQLDVAIDHQLLEISSRPSTAPPITVAYRGHFREVAPGNYYSFRLIKPRERDRNENCRP